MVQVDKRQHERVLSYIELAKKEGATLLTGGKACEGKGYYIEPTIFIDVTVSHILNGQQPCILHLHFMHLTSTLVVAG